jgi:hypothetical protein
MSTDEMHNPIFRRVLLRTGSATCDKYTKLALIKQSKTNVAVICAHNRNKCCADTLTKRHQVSGGYYDAQTDGPYYGGIQHADDSSPSYRGPQPDNFCFELRVTWLSKCACAYFSVAATWQADLVETAAAANHSVHRGQDRAISSL